MSSSLAVAVSASAATITLAGLVAEPLLAKWWRAPRIAFRDLRAYRRINGDSTAPVNKFFEWRETQWSKLAGGLAALGVTLLASLVAASFDSNKATTAVATGTDTYGQPTITTTTTKSSSDDDPQVIVMMVVGTAWISAAAAWQRARVIQDAYTTEVGRLMRIPGKP